MHIITQDPTRVIPDITADNIVILEIGDPVRCLVCISNFAGICTAKESCILDVVSDNSIRSHSVRFGHGEYYLTSNLMDAVIQQYKFYKSFNLTIRKIIVIRLEQDIQELIELYNIKNTNFIQEIKINLWFTIAEYRKTNVSR